MSACTMIVNGNKWIIFAFPLDRRMAFAARFAFLD
jgi:hypothetical protein